MTKYDSIIKEIYQSLGTLIIKSILELGDGTLQHLNVELPQTEDRRLDFLARFEQQGIEELIHIEFQSSNDPTMPYRMLNYAEHILSKFGNLKLNQAVIYMGKSPININTSLENESRISRLSYKYKLIDMSAKDSRDFLESSEPGMLVLAILTRYENPTTLIKTVLTKLQQVTSTSQFADYYQMLENLTGLRPELQDILEKEVTNMGLELDITKTKTYKKGLEQGKEEGKKEGKEEGIIRIIIKVLRSRFVVSPALEKELTAQLKAVKNLETLEQLHDLALEIETIEDFKIK